MYRIILYSLVVFLLFLALPSCNLGDTNTESQATLLPDFGSIQQDGYSLSFTELSKGPCLFFRPSGDHDQDSLFFSSVALYERLWDTEFENKFFLSSDVADMPSGWSSLTVDKLISWAELNYANSPLILVRDGKVSFASPRELPNNRWLLYSIHKLVSDCGDMAECILINRPEQYVEPALIYESAIEEPQGRAVVVALIHNIYDECKDVNILRYLYDHSLSRSHLLRCIFYNDISSADIDNIRNYLGIELPVAVPSELLEEQLEHLRLVNFDYPANIVFIFDDSGGLFSAFYLIEGCDAIESIL